MSNKLGLKILVPTYSANLRRLGLFSLFLFSTDRQRTLQVRVSVGEKLYEAAKNLFAGSTESTTIAKVGIFRFRVMAENAHAKCAEI